MKIVNKNFRFTLGLVIVLSALFTSCNPKDDNNTSFEEGGITEAVLDLGSSIQRDFMGRIVDEANSPVENVNITIGSKVIFTDENGMFIIHNADVNEEQAFITAEKSGYLKGMRTVVPTQGINQVRITLITENLAGTVASGNNSEVSLPNGTKISFDGDFKDENGNAYSGNVKVFVYHLNPANPDVNHLMPGNLQAQNSNGQERVLETYGMINVELKGDSGEKLNIADGSLAQLEFPVDPAQTNVAPATIPLWHFDEVNGYWIEDGAATLVGGKYVGEVSHFSWWNCDAQFATVSLCLNIVDDTNTAISNVRVELWRSGAVYPNAGYSNGDGEICGLIPANEVLTLKTFNQCGDLEYTTTVGPFAADTHLGDIVLASAISTTITGNLVDCSSVDVSNGYVVLGYGNQYTISEVTNGSFSFSVLECDAALDFTLEAVDYDTLQTTNELTFNFSNSDVGNIIACNAITQYLNIQIDNDPATYYLLSIDATVYEQGVGFTVNAKSNTGPADGWFYLRVNTVTPGTYPFSEFGFQSGNINMDESAFNTLELTLASYGNIGDYIDGTISGTYTDYEGNIRNLSITIHVIRDM